MLSCPEGEDLAACLKALQNDDILIVWKRDRLGRNLRHLRQAGAFEQTYYYDLYLSLINKLCLNHTLPQTIKFVRIVDDISHCYLYNWHSLFTQRVSLCSYAPLVHLVICVDFIDNLLSRIKISS